MHFLRNYFFGDYLEKGEKIHYIAHRSLVIMVPALFRIFIFGFVVPYFARVLFPQIGTFAYIWMAIGGARVLYELYGWYYDVWLITDRAVIDVKSKSLFDVATTRIEYHMIEGITYVIEGFWKTIFSVGDVVLEKVGAGTHVKLPDAANPKRVEEKVLHYQEEYIGRKGMRDHQALKHLLSEMLHEHIREYGFPTKEE